MSTYIVTEIALGKGRGHEHLRYFRLTMPGPCEKGGYTQAISFTYFFQGMKSRNRNTTSLFHAEREDDMIGPFGDYKREQMSLKGVTECPDLWAFYREIGYDYKK